MIVGIESNILLIENIWILLAVGNVIDSRLNLINRMPSGLVYEGFAYQKLSSKTFQ